MTLRYCAERDPRGLVKVTDTDTGRVGFYSAFSGDAYVRVVGMPETLNDRDVLDAMYWSIEIE